MSLIMAGSTEHFYYYYFGGDLEGAHLCDRAHLCEILDEGDSDRMGEGEGEGFSSFVSYSYGVFLN